MSISPDEIERLAREEYERMNETPKRGRGRPRKSVSEKQQPFDVYLTASERAFVDGHGGSAYVRALVRLAMKRGDLAALLKLVQESDLSSHK